MPWSAAHNLDSLTNSHSDVCLPLRRFKINVGNSVTNIGYNIFRGKRIQGKGKNIKSTRGQLQAVSPLLPSICPVTCLTTLSILFTDAVRPSLPLNQFQPSLVLSVFRVNVKQSGRLELVAACIFKNFFTLNSLHFGEGIDSIFICILAARS